jgi:hypothetical protein
MVAKGRSIRRRREALHPQSDYFWLDAHAVIDCYAQFLFAAQVSLLRRQGGGMPHRANFRFARDPGVIRKRAYIRDGDSVT